MCRFGGIRCESLCLVSMLASQWRVRNTRPRLGTDERRPALLKIPRLNGERSMAASIGSLPRLTPLEIVVHVIADKVLSHTLTLLTSAAPDLRF